MSGEMDDRKKQFNALANAKHIYSYKENGIVFKILRLVEYNQVEGIKAIVQFEDGSIDGLYTDSNIAATALKEVIQVFGEEQPFIKIKLKTTSKGISLYYVEVV